MNKVLLSILCTSLFFLSCINSVETSPKKEIRGDLFKQNEIGFEINVPEDWTNSLDETVSGQKCELVSRNRRENNFAANIIIVSTSHSGSRDMHEILNQYKTIISSQFPGVSFLTDSVYSVQGVAIGKVIYTGTLLGNAVKIKELLFIQGNYDVQMVFTDLDESFDTRGFDKIEKSLAFRD